ncbi:hypothetical protein, partial [Oharaeibacter diazotrophicus]
MNAPLGGGLVGTVVPLPLTRAGREAATRAILARATPRPLPADASADVRLREKWRQECERHLARLMWMEPLHFDRIVTRDPVTGAYCAVIPVDERADAGEGVDAERAGEIERLRREVARLAAERAAALEEVAVLRAFVGDNVDLAAQGGAEGPTLAGRVLALLR